MSAQYRNPVYPLEFADPFVLQTHGVYYAYGTAPAGEDGRIFPVLRSTDLVHWERLGGALLPLTEPRAFSYWAPEVAEKDGRFFLFYSASTSPSDEHHRLRVAISDSPQGPFTDSGRELLPGLGFSIDASPFHDPQSGKFYLFFATDYEKNDPTGTGLAVVELADDLLSATMPPTPVIRATADWQIYERNRNYKGKVWPRWYCVEGPSVLFHDGKYYCFFSGGTWYADNYGVSYAIADHPLGPSRADPAAAGTSGYVLKGIPDKVLGPGHNSFAKSPDGKTLYMVYHAWDAAKTARRMCIDPVIWTHSGPKVDGPSTEERELG